MKKNWIKGLDRIAILLAIPIATIGGYYSSNVITKSQSVWVYFTSEDDAELEAYNKELSQTKDSFFNFKRNCSDIFGFSWDGVLANGEKELKEQSKKHPIATRVLNRAFSEGGDLHGTLVKNREFGLSYVFDDEVSLIPRKSKRYMFSILGGVGIAFGFIFGIGLTTRVVPRIYQWVKDGFCNNHKIRD